MRLNLRQQEETHIMENIIFNELVQRGYAVDIGVIQLSEKAQDGKIARKNCEIDFVANLGSRRYYIQSAFDVPTIEKREQEERSLLNINDSFKKIIVQQSIVEPWHSQQGVLYIGIEDFLLNAESVDL
jgi:predicted AAA+ superfamily ATPase